MLSLAVLAFSLGAEPVTMPAPVVMPAPVLVGSDARPVMAVPQPMPLWVPPPAPVYYLVRPPVRLLSQS